MFRSKLYIIIIIIIIHQLLQNRSQVASIDWQANQEERMASSQAHTHLYRMMLRRQLHW